MSLVGRYPSQLGSRLLQCSRLPAITSVRSTSVVERTRVPRRIGFPDASQEYINRRAWNRPLDKNRTYRLDEKEQDPVPVKVILLSDTDDYGLRGQVRTIPCPEAARDEVLLPGFGVYASEENLRKYKDILIPEEDFKYSSETAQKILPKLRRTAIPISMNLYNEWTLEAWHIRLAFFKLNFFVPVEAIEMPKGEIKGPNLDNENKEFLVTVTVNKMERVKVRCVLHHLSDEIRNPGWQHMFLEPLFEGQREELKMIPRNHIGPEARAMPHFKRHIGVYSQWRQEVDEKRLQQQKE